MFLSSNSNVDEDIEDMEDFENSIPESKTKIGLPGDCIREVLEFLDPEEDYWTCLNVVHMAKYVMTYFFDLYPYALGKYIFNVTKPEYLKKQEIKYIFQLVIDDKKCVGGKRFNDSMFKCFPNLQRLIIKTPRKDIKNSGFQYVPNLRYLEINAYRKIAGSKMSITSNIFKTCTKLEKLFLWNLRHNFFRSKSMKNLVNLEVLYVSGSFVGDKIFDMIPPSVKKLRFFGCDMISTDSFKKLHGGLEMVAIRKCMFVREKNVREILENVDPKTSIHYQR